MTDDVTEKPRDRFNFRDLLEGIDQASKAEGLVLKDETGDEPKDFVAGVLAMPKKDKAFNAKVLRKVGANIEALGMLLLLKQMNDNSKVFKDDDAFRAATVALTLGAMIVTTFAGSIDKMSDADFDKIKAGLAAMNQS